MLVVYILKDERIYNKSILYIYDNTIIISYVQISIYLKIISRVNTLYYMFNQSRFYKFSIWETNYVYIIKNYQD